jgi:hypothetical protein
LNVNIEDTDSYFLNDAPHEKMVMNKNAGLRTLQVNIYYGFCFLGDQYNNEKNNALTLLDGA